MTLTDPIHDHPTPEEQRPAYRELWKSERGDKAANVRVYLDGTEEIEEHPEIAPPDVLAHLRANGLHFVRLLPKGGGRNLRPPGVTAA